MYSKEELYTLSVVRAGLIDVSLELTQLNDRDAAEHLLFLSKGVFEKIAEHHMGTLTKVVIAFAVYLNTMHKSKVATVDGGVHDPLSLTISHPDDENSQASGHQRTITFHAGDGIVNIETSNGIKLPNIPIEQQSLEKLLQNITANIWHDLKKYVKLPNPLYKGKDLNKKEPE